jgi:hypothetical protein
MKSSPRNDSLIRTLCEPSSLGDGLVVPALVAALVAVPAAFVMDPMTQLLAPSRLVAIVLAPGRLITTLATVNPKVLGDFLKPNPAQSLPAFLVNLLYWFLIFFGVSCRLAGLRRADRDEPGASS